MGVNTYPSVCEDGPTVCGDIKGGRSHLSGEVNVMAQVKFFVYMLKVINEFLAVWIFFYPILVPSEGELINQELSVNTLMRCFAA